MSEIRFELNGTTAAIAGAVAIVVVGLHVATIGQPVDDPDLERRVRVQLMSESFPAAADAATAAFAAGDDAGIAQVIDAMEEGGVELHTIEVSEPITAMLGGRRDAVVKVSFTLTTGERAGQEQVLYYLYEHSPVTNHWSYQYETSSIAYWTNMF